MGLNPLSLFSSVHGLIDGDITHHCDSERVDGQINCHTWVHAEIGVANILNPSPSHPILIIRLIFIFFRSKPSR
jgi:hypothetical protein